ncbi:MAG: MBL fold metallo-hydrolase [Bacteroidota bacterium]
MTIRFWGVRGSIPSPGPQTVRYGGNTTCVTVEHEGTLLILDAGTGLFRLGQALREAPRGLDLVLMFSHRHLDHVSSFPFFWPLWQPGRTLHLVDYTHEGEVWSPLDLLDGVLYPMTPSMVAATCHRVADGPAFLAPRGFHVRTMPLNHPGGAYGYRITCAEKTWVHLTDNELDAADGAPFETFVAFCQGADVLTHDAHLVASDLPGKAGWGHTRIRRAADLARAAQAKHLVLIHHAPERTDDELDALQAEVRAYLAPHGIACTAAYEGLAIEL